MKTDKKIKNDQTCKITIKRHTGETITWKNQTLKVQMTREM